MARTAVRAHVVGNGPSWVEFNKIDESDLAIGCNITKAKVDKTLLSDVRLLRLLESGKLNVEIPLIVNDLVSKELELNPPKKVEVYSTYKRPEGMETNVWSSGHFAALWLIEQGYKEIHLWGIDSLFYDHTYSHTFLIRKAMYPELYKTKGSKSDLAIVANRWREGWNKIIKDAPSVNIVMHKPIGDYSDIKKMGFV